MTLQKQKLARSSPDVRNADDFTFEPYAQMRGEGFSGGLLLATRKGNPAEQYVVKHMQCCNAANEYVFSKLAEAVGAKMPKTVLFMDPSHSGVFRFYAVGSRLVEKQPCPSTELLLAQAHNWQDFYYHITLSILAGEADNVDFLLDTNNLLYRIDAAETFRMVEFYMFNLVHWKLGHPKRQAVEELMAKPLDDLWSQLYSGSWLKRFSDEHAPLLLEPLRRMQELPDSYIDEFLSILCCFYPEQVGEYYRRFVREAREMAAKVVRLYG